METHNVERRLAAVLAADVVGYSRLMEVDEAGTLARLKTIRLELIDPAIAKCRGRIIKTTGDGILVEFQSVTEALTCAVEFQERMARRNRDMPAARALLHRIGINLGDVIVEDNDIFGDGVNVAARLEAMAEPGEICISGAVRDQVGDRLKVGFYGSWRPSRPRTSAGRSAPTRFTSRGKARGGARGARSRGAHSRDRPEALDRGPPVRQYERRPGTGILRRRADRGHHHRTLAFPPIAGDLAKRHLRPQGEAGQGQADRPRIRRRLHRRGERSQGGRSGQGHGPAHRRGRRKPTSGPNATTASSRTFSPSRTKSPRRSPPPCSAASRPRGTIARSERRPRTWRPMNAF